MTESQFAYGSFTLDELRSLAASPQVGTMQAMPQSFRALADRVGEVADLLSHAQADLPNWWKGPAAQQAAAALGRAAAEAREFHDSAMGAATAVSRCAQVVAEQQNQMMNVPDVPEPGISAVVQQPATPFEALEAARQDAAYQAAHEQAVQVVNGIAAQYVETRAALSTISAAKGENFVSSPTAPSEDLVIPPLGSEPPDAKPPSNLKSNQIQLHSRVADGMTTRERSSTAELSSARTKDSFYSRSDFATRSTAPSHIMPASELNEALPSKPIEALSSSRFITGRTIPSVAAPIIESEPLLALDDGASTSMIAPLSGQKLHEPMNQFSGTRRSDRSQEPTLAAPVKEPARTGFAGQRSAKDFELEDVGRLGAGDLSTQPSPYLADHPKIDALNNDTASAAIMPPYGSVGSVRRTGEEREPRPAYLKERKSVWLPDTVAVPADGIIAPEWFELT